MYTPTNSGTDSHGAPLLVITFQARCYFEENSRQYGHVCMNQHPANTGSHRPPLKVEP